MGWYGRDLRVALQLVSRALFPADVPADDWMIVTAGKEHLLLWVPFEAPYCTQVSFQSRHQFQVVAVMFQHKNLSFFIAYKYSLRLDIILQSSANTGLRISDQSSSCFRAVNIQELVFTHWQQPLRVHRKHHLCHSGLMCSITSDLSHSIVIICNLEFSYVPVVHADK